MVKSPIKIIDSGTAPTTENLGEGQIAFGTVDGATKLYGSDGTTVTDLSASGGQGPQGPAGEDGITPTIGDNGNWFLGTTTTGEAGTEATVTNSGTTSAAVLNFTIPKGAKGDKGDKGDTGDTGPAGTTTFAGLTDQPTDNAALKTALDAKADQTAVDTKVSSVTAGTGISITGSATAPVVNGMIAVPDYDNAQSITPAISDRPFTAPSTGVIYDVGTPDIPTGQRGTLMIKTSESGSAIPLASVANWFDEEKGFDITGAFPIQKGTLAWVDAPSGSGPASLRFAPYKFVEIS